MKKAAAVLALAGAILLGYWLTIHIQERQFESEAVEKILVETPKQALPEKAPRLAAGSLIARLQIPSIGLSVAVVEGASDSQLRLAAGRIFGTALPGENSNVAFAGHRDTHFRPLRSIRLNDKIEVNAAGRLYEYRVVSTKIVQPEDIQVLYPADRETLTLVTCYPFSYIGSAPQRFIVRAECTNCQQ